MFYEGNQNWDSPLSRPRLQISLQGDGKPVLLDTRGLDGTEIKTELNAKQINVLLDCSKYSGDSIQEWALGKKAAIVEGDDFISLVMINSEIREKYEN